MEDVIDQVKETLLVIDRFINSDKCTRTVNLKLISFSTEATINYPDGSSTFQEAINGIHAEGVTNMSDAIMLSHSLIDKSENYQVVVMLSDGMPNRGMFQSIDDLASLSAKLDTVARKGLTKISIGYGHEYNPKLLEVLGDFSYAKNMSDVKEIIPCILGQMLTIHSTNGKFKIDFPYLRLVIGEQVVGSMFNEQVFHLGLAVNPKEFNKANEISFQYTDITTGELITLTTKIVEGEEIPPHIMGMYHEAACLRLIDAYQERFRRRQQTNADVILIQERILAWHESPTREACLRRIEDMMKSRINEYETTELKCTSTKQKTVRADSGYSTTNQMFVCSSFNDMY